jgi:hypothetical protein
MHGVLDRWRQGNMEAVRGMVQGYAGDMGYHSHDLWMHGLRVFCSAAASHTGHRAGRSRRRGRCRQKNGGHSGAEHKTGRHLVTVFSGLDTLGVHGADTSVLSRDFHRGYQLTTLATHARRGSNVARSARLAGMPPNPGMGCDVEPLTHRCGWAGSGSPMLRRLLNGFRAWLASGDGAQHTPASLGAPLCSGALGGRDAAAVALE